MKKLVLLLAILLMAPTCHAQSANIDLLAQKGFFERPSTKSSFLTPTEEVRRTLFQHLKYANAYNLKNLKSLYADNYVNGDGINKDIYFDLIKKTWESYPDIKYKLDIKNISVDGNRAIAQTIETAFSSTGAKSGIVNENGTLESSSSSIYYMEKVDNAWLITSDYIVSEKTFLRYGSAKDLNVDLSAPSQVPANTPYSAVLQLQSPKDSLIIASIGHEKITYPQVVAEEVFRKVPEDGILERMFNSNDKNINEYAVASFGITRAEVKNTTEIKIYVTGLGFVMTRVNVIPKNNYIKASADEKAK
jgi:hypothetical protein